MFIFAKPSLPLLASLADVMTSTDSKVSDVTGRLVIARFLEQVLLGEQPSFIISRVLIVCSKYMVERLVM